MFQSIKLIEKPNDFTSEKTIKKVADFFISKGKTIVGTDEKSDLIVVIAGDGTLLNTARLEINENTPILGINLGHLGFLIDVSIENMFEVLEEVLRGVFTEEKRTILKTNIGGQKYTAINDIVIHKHNSMRMIEFEVYVDGCFVSKQRADGLIIASPTGSTAYSLSSGGPIMHPDIEAISLVSICPHTLSHRPIVLPSSANIEIKMINSPDNNAQVIIDGQINIEIEINTKIKISKNDNFMRLVHPKSYNYFEVVRSKLKWGEKL